MKLEQLLKGIEIINIKGDINKEIQHLSDNSSTISSNCLFVAIKGININGHEYISKAIKNGGIAIVYEKKLPKKVLNKNITFVKVSNSRKALAILASNYYGNPAKKLTLIGITGTNGKTTTSELTYQLLKNSGKQVGLSSTVSAKWNKINVDTGYHVTCPGPIILHNYLKKMVDCGCKYAVIEVTSHGIDQFRTYGLNFEVCAVTNITSEHLDYHKTLDNYIKTKAKIFDQSEKIALNKHDVSLNKLKILIPTRKKVRIVDYKIQEIPKNFSKHFPGTYNQENLAMAREITKILLGKVSKKALGSFLPVTGRMEQIPNNKHLKIIVDFAHDAVSLENALKTVRDQTKGKLIVVFGCVGLRDTAKRPEMGKTAMTIADKVIVTTDDPRTENLDKINKSIKDGIISVGGKEGKNYYIIPNRQKAVNFAIQKIAKRGDSVLLAGKGHEKTMCIGTTEHPWTDQRAAKRALEPNSEKNLKS